MRPAISNSFPTELTSFIGRKAELNKLQDLLTNQRYILITGMAGVGKTRLVYRLAQSVRRAFEDQVILIGAQTFGTSAELIASIADTVGVPHEKWLEGITQTIRRRPTLLIIDGVDDPILDISATVEALLHACPELKIVTTGRRRTNVIGERVFTVGPFSVPTPEVVDGIGIQQALKTEAVELLVESIRESIPDFEASNTNAEALFTICRVTSGIPRSLEAAGRAHSVFGAHQLAKTLIEKPLLLEEFVVPAQNGMTRRALEEGLEQLPQKDRTLFHKLAIFSSPFDLNFAAEVFAGEDASALAPSLSRLVEHSLVASRFQEGEPLFSLMYPYREIALEELTVRGGREPAEAQLREKLISHLNRAGSEWYSENQLPEIRFLNRYTAEITELLESLAQSPRESVQALELICGLRFYWQLRAAVPWPRARDWIGVALESKHVPKITRLRALQVDAYIAFYESDLEGAESQLHAASKIASEIQPGASEVLFGMFVHGLVMFGGQNFVVAEEIFRQVVEADMTGRGMADQIGERYWFLAVTRFARGDYQEAEQWAQQGIRFCEQHGDLWGRAYTQWLLALLLLRRSELEDASDVLRQATEVILTSRDRTGLVLVAQLAAAIAIAQGDHQFAARISQTLPVEDDGYAPMSSDLIGASQLEEIKAIVGEAPFYHHHLEANVFTVPDAISYVLKKDSSMTDPGEALTHSLEARGSLSAREWEIAELVAEGLSNPMIATRLVISRRTVEGHVQRIFGKLGFRSRSQIAVWMTEQRSGRAIS